MISLEDMVGMSGLSEEEILAIAEHEHVPPSVATNLGSICQATMRACRRCVI
jgi:hypothetical protein